jgi:hypothetical protein
MPGKTTKTKSKKLSATERWLPVAGVTAGTAAVTGGALYLMDRYVWGSDEDMRRNYLFELAFTRFQLLITTQNLAPVWNSMLLAKRAMATDNKVEAAKQFKTAREALKQSYPDISEENRDYIGSTIMMFQDVGEERTPVDRVIKDVLQKIKAKDKEAGKTHATGQEYLAKYRTLKEELDKPAEKQRRLRRKPRKRQTRRSAKRTRAKSTRTRSTRSTRRTRKGKRRRRRGSGSRRSVGRSRTRSRR